MVTFSHAGAPHPTRSESVPGHVMTEGRTILCPACHQENNSGARFCKHCGHDLEFK
ncbi:MAG: zinc-ribbon domain-containing protein [Chloroflexaceae bacterium]|nr:zinc-ribbon domain-containing protein [Chloroflexaceae bacterium]